MYSDDRIFTSLEERLGVKSLPFVDYRKYSRIRKWTLEISRGKELIAIIRVSEGQQNSRLLLSELTVQEVIFMHLIQCGEKSDILLPKNLSLLQCLMSQDTT